MSQAPAAGERPYRPCVGIMLVNRSGRVFVAKRADTPGDHWQMPQGGIDAGETPRAAALRELAEEIGTDNAEIIAESAGWLDYDVPPAIAGQAWGGRFRGQTQKWFLMRFLGEDRDIRIDGHHTPEFTEWRWAELADLPRMIVDFKRAVYEAVLREFAPLARKLET
jgi:putative (di)nucleoside polyphosphate hydrolase